MQEMLYNRYAPVMYGVSLRYTDSTAEAQDILQEGFIKVFRHLGKFRQEGSFEGWIRRIMVNTAIEHFRKKKPSAPVSEKEAYNIEETDASALDQLAEKDIIELIARLPPGYRTVFNLFVIEGFNHKEIAAMLQITEGTSKSQLARAKAALQKMVAVYLNEIRTNQK